MPNPMTGDFDAVVQIAIRQINGLLATLHENSFSSSATLKLLHQTATRVGDTRRRPPEQSAFNDWVLEYQRGLPPGPTVPVRDLLVASSLPAVGKRLETAFGTLDPLLEPSPPGIVRGSAYAQLSNVTVSVAAGSTSELTVALEVRARYTGDPGTTPLPSDIHGTVRAAFRVRCVRSGDRARLHVSASPDDHKITFNPAPGSNVSGPDVARIIAEVRALVRGGFKLLPVDLGDKFSFTEFTGVGSGATAAIALPLQLSTTAPPSSGLQAIAQSIVADYGFAFAVSSEYVRSLVDVDAIRDAVNAIEYTVFHVTIRPQFTSGPQLSVQSGQMELTGTIEVQATGGITSTFGLRQALTLSLDVESQLVRVVRLGNPELTTASPLLLPFVATAAQIIAAQIDQQLVAINDSVGQVFADAKADLVAALARFEKSPSVSYAQVEVTTDGVIVRGDMAPTWRLGPVVSFEDLPDGTFSAFESWIPGGWIERFSWSWLEHPSQMPSILSGVAKAVTSTASYRLEIPADSGIVDRVCLRVNGTRLLPDGTAQNVSLGTTCELAEPMLTIGAPSWWEPLLVPVWRADVAPDTRLMDAIIAHVGVQKNPPDRDPGSNIVVFFPDWGSNAALEPLARALDHMQRAAALHGFIMVVPEGALAATRREIDARLATLSPRLSLRVQLAEDLTGGWSRTFDVQQPPAVFLIDARRQLAWGASGILDPAAIASALDRHVVAGAAHRFKPMRLKVAIGSRAPRIAFIDDRGVEHALHRLRGRRVMLSFWRTLAPCFTELRRLQHLADADPRALAVFGIHGGARPEDLDAARTACAIRFPLIQDGHHRVTRACGVRCWPTTIEIDQEGTVAEIRLGISTERDGAAAIADAPEGIANAEASS